MKPEIYPNALYRIPQFPMDATLEESWEDLKYSIWLSSPDFYGEIKDITSTGLNSLPERAAHTVWKYFNRARYRCTPFGSFASVMMVPVRNRKEGGPVVITETQCQHAFTGWKESQRLFQTQELTGDTLLVGTGMYYRTAEVIRYITLNEGIFRLNELEATEQITAILERCRQKIPLKALAEELRSTQVTADPLPLITELIIHQLLITDKHPNITGDDYFQRLPAADYQAEHSPYVISERSCIGGSLDKQIFRYLPDLTGLLQSIAMTAERTSLAGFCSRFLQKFESAEIPLLTALDPETGVGYADLEMPSDDEGFPTALLPGQAVNGPAIKDMLLAGLLKGPGNMPASIDLSALTTAANLPLRPTANTFSLMGRRAGNMILIENLGGISANALTGRFSHTGEPFRRACRELADLEQQANPDVCFFDVAYSAEPGVDNVNRRLCLYPYELPLLTYSTTAEPLALNDLTIHVAGDEIILRSTRLNRRVVPRIASAYNYRRSDLAAFRFLSDLQYQNLEEGLFFDPETLIPSLERYPRVTFRNFIVSPAKWRIRSQDCQPLTCNTLKVYLQQKGIPRYFSSGKSDMTLTFDREQEADLRALVTELKKEKTLLLREELPDTTIVTSLQKRPYNHQFILSLWHGGKLYSDIRPRFPMQDHLKVYPPGSEWLYWQIFCHPMRMDTLITGFEPVLKALKKEIACWFFIRYRENGDHLRLRVRPGDPRLATQFLTAVSGALNDALQSGQVSGFRLETYRPEAHRYGPQQMPQAEQHFSADSRYVLELLKRNYPAMIKYRLCAPLFSRVEESGLFSPGEFRELVNRISGSYNREHGLSPDEFKLLNAEYKRYRNTLLPKLTRREQQLQDRFIQSALHTLAQYPSNLRAAIFGDLIHMHVNRLFSDNQRSHEMMLYYFLVKETTSRLARIQLQERA